MPRGGDDIDDLEDLLLKEDFAGGGANSPEIIIDPDGTKKYLHPETELLHNETGPALIHPDGKKEYYLNGMLDSIDDKPSIIYTDGTREWYIKDELGRRSGGPSRISDGRYCQEWHVNGKLESIDDKPSRIYSDKYDDARREWHKNNLLHRDDDKPAVLYDDGSEEYFQHGKRHRIGAPAIIYSNEKRASSEGGILKTYYEEGICKRSDGGPCDIGLAGDLGYWEGYSDFLGAHIYYYVYPSGVKELWDENATLLISNRDKIHDPNLTPAEPLNLEKAESLEFARIIKAMYKEACSKPRKKE